MGEWINWKQRFPNRGLERSWRLQIPHESRDHRLFTFGHQSLAQCLEYGMRSINIYQRNEGIYRIMKEEMLSMKKIGVKRWLSAIYFIFYLCLLLPATGYVGRQTCRPRPVPVLSWVWRGPKLYQYPQSYTPGIGLVAYRAVAHQE